MMPTYIKTASSIMFTNLVLCSWKHCQWQRANQTLLMIHFLFYLSNCFFFMMSINFLFRGVSGGDITATAGIMGEQSSKSITDLAKKTHKLDIKPTTELSNQFIDFSKLLNEGLLIQISDVCFKLDFQQSVLQKGTDKNVIHIYIYSSNRFTYII